MGLMTDLSVVQLADILSDALATDAGMALHVHVVTNGENDLVLLER